MPGPLRTQDTTGAVVIEEFSNWSIGAVPVEGLVGLLRAKVKNAQRGDLGDVEALLVAQAVTLNSR